MRLVSLFAVVVLVAIVAGCSSGDATDVERLDPPAQAVQDLLDLRVERSADASAYAEYLTDPTVAQELAAADAAAEATTVGPIPEWQEPYVSDAKTDTAEVVVVWIPDDDHPGWPFATVFSMESDDGLWKASDANAVTRQEDLPEPAE